MPSDDLFVVFNPRSGKGRGARLVGPVLEALGPETAHGMTAAAGDEARITAEALGRGFRRIVDDRTVLMKCTVLAYGPTETIFTRANLEAAFGGVLRHFTIGGSDLHEDDDTREVRIGLSSLLK